MERELRLLASHGCAYTSMVACRSAFRRKYARVVSFRSRWKWSLFAHAGCYL
ncbi:hypothetical protein T06_13089 [Trichinella sp. T6]|nr:hypothetical protein T06_13089 [Trichinella sp. T6]